MYTDKQKIYMKSNKLCAICGKIIENEDYEATKTRRNTYIVVHKRCI